MYLETWYRDTDHNNFGLTKLTLNGEINMITGMVAYVLLALVALSSLNSVAASLNWSEWRFVQTKLGMICLAFGLTHAISMYLNIFLDRNKYNYSTVYLLTRVKLIAIYFPLLVVVLRLIFGYFRPLASKIENIRDGSIMVKVV
jgi:DMSO/TMAO reductase YedYZ heme-binding membrane subunit